MLQHSLKTILGILLLQVSSTALAFTLIEIPQEEITPSNTITDSMTLNTQIRPIAGAIKAHLRSTRRISKSEKKAQYGNVLAANSYVDSISDVDHMMLAYNDLASVGSSGGGSSGGDERSLWINSTFSSLKNDFSRTSFNGDVHILLAGYDYTLSEKYIFGVALSHETSNFNTRFNSGNEKTNGFSINPYFAVLLSDTWSFDLSLGHGKFNTGQSRTTAVILPGPVIANAIVDSGFSSTRNFVSTNITNVSAWGDWNLTGSFGLFAAKQKQDAYVESSGGAVAGASQTIKQWNLAGEAAYSHRDSESYVGLNYEKDKDPERIQFATGEQPSNDAASFVVTAGWRHFGKDLTANFVFSSRRGLDNISDNGVSTTIRINL